MIKLLTNAQMRSADEYTIKGLGIPSQTLMKRAGKCIANRVEEVLKERNAKTVVVVCGKGNNGGDGYVCARLLQEKEIEVYVYAVEGKLSPDCSAERKKYKGDYTIRIQGDIIVDCLLGTGFSAPLSDEIKTIIDKINASKGYVISVDIPSGLSGDNGLGATSVRADETLAIAEYKLGHILQDGKDRCGKTQKCDIGIVCNDRGYAELCEEKDIVKLFPKRARNTNKGSFGTATLIAGSEQYIGTAQLALGGALKSGCGYVKLCCPDKLKYAIAPIYPQAIYCDSEDLSSDCIAIGMGCGVSTALYEKIKYLLNEYKGTLIIDADGLNTLAKYGVGVLKDAKCKVILTPHIKEFSRLSGQDVSKITQNSVDLCRDFANDKGVTVLLKSSSSILSDGKKVVVIDRGSSALAKAGSGDMLSGFMCGSIARGLSPFNGAMCAGYVLGCAGELVAEQFTEYCANSADILNILPCVVKRLTH